MVVGRTDAELTTFTHHLVKLWFNEGVKHAYRAMSINLQLKATRQVFTKSGREFQQTEDFNLRQTPDNVTWDILSKGSFNDKLDAYEQWCSDRPEECYESFHPLIEDEGGKLPSVGEEFYFSDSGDTDYPPMIVKGVVLRGDPKFSDIAKEDWFYWTAIESESVVAFLEVRNMSHCESLRWKISKYKEDEWEFEFYAL